MQKMSGVSSSIWGDHGKKKIGDIWYPRGDSAGLYPRVDIKYPTEILEFSER